MGQLPDKARGHKEECPGLHAMPPGCVLVPFPVIEVISLHSPCMLPSFVQVRSACRTLSEYSLGALSGIAKRQPHSLRLRLCCKWPRHSLARETNVRVRVLCPATAARAPVVLTPYSTTAAA
ncbi:hypothetical protein HaLaN_23794 [Haematococcus lacustris]|uniref:Uncharacterized protein n=1 Tax=Haematococcus lacustris TaxID=44745 RepID=A0A6A0A1R8_HAELA|nr:hypothetical protein HaLaN_23794 [Haematococcus lacustris]